MKTIEIIKPGSLAEYKDTLGDVVGRIAAVQLSESLAAIYLVVHWAGRERKENWVGGDEIKVLGEKSGHVTIGVKL